MPAVHITASSADALKIYFQCQIHASKSPCCVWILLFALGCLATALLFNAGEWISGATCNYIASFLTENYDKNEEVTLIQLINSCYVKVNCRVLSLQVTNLLKSVEFIFVPFVNPDGYVVSLHLPCMSVTIVCCLLFLLLLLFLLFVIVVCHCFIIFVIIVCCCCYYYCYPLLFVIVVCHCFIIFVIIVCCCCYYYCYPLLFVVMAALSHLQYTWSNDRLWRKNRRKGILCDGVDLNRNYNSKWGGVSYPASFFIRLCMINTSDSYVYCP